MRDYIFSGRDLSEKERKRLPLMNFLLIGVPIIAFIILWIYVCIMFYFF